MSDDREVCVMCNTEMYISSEMQAIFVKSRNMALNSAKSSEIRTVSFMATTVVTNRNKGFSMSVNRASLSLQIAERADLTQGKRPTRPWRVLVSLVPG